MPEWKVEIDWDTVADTGADAQAWVPSHYHRSHVRLAPKWADCAPDELEDSLVHELLHLVFRDMQHVAVEQSPSCGDSSDATIRAAWNHAEESAIDRLAGMLVPLAPVLEGGG